MSKETGVIVIGLWVLIVPFLGFPGSWKTVLLALTGVGLMALGVYLRNEAIGRGTASSRTPFRENVHETHVGEEVR